MPQYRKIAGNAGTKHRRRALLLPLAWKPASDNAPQPGGGARSHIRLIFQEA